jgi:hypothetical protein
VENGSYPKIWFKLGIGGQEQFVMMEGFEFNHKNARERRCKLV